VARKDKNDPCENLPFAVATRDRAKEVTAGFQPRLTRGWRTGSKSCLAGLSQSDSRHGVDSTIPTTSNSPSRPALAAELPFARNHSTYQLDYNTPERRVGRWLVGALPCVRGLSQHGLGYRALRR
jgi:hypothetical protein